MAGPPSISEAAARLAALRRGSAPREVSPAGAATPEQLEAMKETVEILSDPGLLARVRAGRSAVAGGDVVPLEDLSDGPLAVGEWRVAITGPVARELSEASESSAGHVREMLSALRATPAEHGRALGMGLVGVWSAREASDRVLYAIAEEQRLVTVISIDRAESRG